MTYKTLVQLWSNNSVLLSPKRLSVAPGGVKSLKCNVVV
jgi:hypothetical protein